MLLGGGALQVRRSNLPRFEGEFGTRIASYRRDEAGRDSARRTKLSHLPISREHVVNNKDRQPPSNHHGCHPEMWSPTPLTHPSKPQLTRATTSRANRSAQVCLATPTQARSKHDIHGHAPCAPFTLLVALRYFAPSDYRTSAPSASLSPARVGTDGLEPDSLPSHRPARSVRRRGAGNQPDTTPQPRRTPRHHWPDAIPQPGRTPQPGDW